MKCSNLFFCRLTPRVLLLELLLLLLENALGTCPAVGGLMASFSAFGALGFFLGSRLLSGLLLALLAAAACVVWAGAELRFTGGYPGLQTFIFVVSSLRDLERGRSLFSAVGGRSTLENALRVFERENSTAAASS